MHNKCYAAWNPYRGTQKCLSVYLEGRGSEMFVCIVGGERVWNVCLYTWRGGGLKCLSVYLEGRVGLKCLSVYLEGRGSEMFVCILRGERVWNVCLYTWRGGERVWNVWLYTWRGGGLKCLSVYLEGRGSENVYCLYTHENVDIFGWPPVWLPKPIDYQL